MATGAPTAPGTERVGVVLAGAGARGAYEAGVLSVLLPVLERTGRRPTVLVGTSAGALNVAFLASVAHLPAQQAADAVVERWVSTRRQDVIGPVAASALVSGLRYGLDFLGTGVRVTGLLDTTPLQRTVESGLDWDQLHRNVGPDGPVQAVAVTATALSDGRTKVFVDESGGATSLPMSDPVRPIDYLPSVIGPEHVLASSAIPVAFPAALVEEPAAGLGWYTDGGVRLNVPIKPAIALGCDRIVVVATTPGFYLPPPAPPDPAGRRPDVFAAANQSLQSLLSDRMVEDLATLAMVNQLTGGTANPAPDHPYRLIPYVFTGPSDRRALGRVAAAVFDDVYASPLRRLRDPDIPLMSRALGGTGPDRDDLLSFLYFEPEFLRAAVDLGRSDATALLATAGPDDPVPWRTDALGPGPA